MRIRAWSKAAAEWLRDRLTMPEPPENYSQLDDWDQPRAPEREEDGSAEGLPYARGDGGFHLATAL